MSSEPIASDLNFHVLTTLLVKGTRDLVGSGTPGDCSMVLSGPNFYPEGVISVTFRLPNGQLTKTEAIRPSDCLFFVAIEGFRIERLEIDAPGSEHVGSFAGAALLAPGEPGKPFRLFHLLARDIRESVRNPIEGKSTEVARLTAGSPSNPDFRRKRLYLKEIGEPWASFTGIAQVFASDSEDALNGADGGAPLQAAVVCEGERVIDQLPTPPPEI